MAIRVNPDGSITVGIIPEEHEEKPQPTVEEKAEETKPKKSTKKSK